MGWSLANVLSLMDFLYPERACELFFFICGVWSHFTTLFGLLVEKKGCVGGLLGVLIFLNLFLKYEVNLGQ